MHLMKKGNVLCALKDGHGGHCRSQEGYQRELLRYKSPEYRQKKNERARERYWSMSGYEFHRRLLQIRRWKALNRMAKRMENPGD